MSDLLNFYGDKSVDVKIEYVVEKYDDLNDVEKNVPFNAAILISSPYFEDIKTINGYPIDCHNTVWVKTTGGNRLYANLNVNSVTLQGCNASTYNLSYKSLLDKPIKEETEQ